MSRRRTPLFIKGQKPPFWGALWLVIFTLFLSSCLENMGEGTRTRDGQALTEEGGGKTAGNGDGKGSAPSDGGFNEGSEIFEAGVTEIRHVVDPFDGTYKTKVTIPKNFRGLLYLSGLNVTSLSDQVVKVRFRFGRDLEPVTIPATVGRAPGITPQTDIEVLILDMTDRPFEDIRLLYDLFDYNDYRDEDGNETLEPVSDPRDGNLYCRGLRLEHDPTFQGSLSNSLCDAQNERCLYAYAKIRDSGLYDVQNSRYLNPSEPQIDIQGGGYLNEPTSLQLKKCLPDNVSKVNTEEVVQSDAEFTGGSNLEYLNSLFFDGDYQYRGPFRALSTSLWEIKGDAVFSEVDVDNQGTGIFQQTLNTSGPLPVMADGGYNSFLFPRAGRLELSSNVEHFSSSQDPFGERVMTSLLSSGETDYVDGCNIRMMNQDSFSNEGISSCNVTAKIEILVRGKNESSDKVRTSTTGVKLQLIRPSLTNFEGKEVLYTSLKNCSSSSACGSNECCFNQRCWSRNLVSQCLEEADIVGHLGIGEACSSDFECSSLCCNSSIGSCQVHINTSEEQKLCSKSPGQKCVTKEYCRKENVTQWFIVKTGVSPSGVQECALRSYNVPTHGDCVNGKCIPPDPPPVPNFDPDEPDCSEAINPPTNL